MVKRSNTIYKFVISTIPSACYKINQNKFIVCVYTLFTSAGIFINAEGDQFLWVEFTATFSLCTAL